MKFENVDDLRVLVETARGGTLTAAAGALGVTPAAASAMLKRLESRLGARLFERSTRAMRLTPQGQTLLDYAQRALELLQEGEAQVGRDSGALVGTVRVAAPSDLTRSVLLPWFGEFMARHAGVRVALSVTDRVQDVMRDAVDVALRYGEPAESGLVARRLFVTHRVASAAPAYLQRYGAPAVPQDLARHNCLTFHLGNRRHAQWTFEQGGSTVRVRVDGDREVDDSGIAQLWALQGHGVIYKSELGMAREFESGALVRLLPGWGGERYVLNAVLPSNRFVPARVRALVDFLAERFAQLEPVSTPAGRPSTTIDPS
jgi:DNA-binding transcriptional LysR family regulator